MNNSIPEKKIKSTPITFHLPVIKVIGLGGGGCNAINRMIELGLSGVEYISANTDAQALKSCLSETKIQLGPKTTRGLGSGGVPAIGTAAAEESAGSLHAALTGADMVFIAAGMGGGTGTGSASVVARIAKSLGAVTVGIVTTPFSFEMGRRQKNALEGMSLLRKYTDTLITIPNDRLLKVASKDLPLELAFRLADDILRQGIQGITELITQPGLINVDFAHIRNLMLNGGGSLLAIGYGQGEGKAVKAVDQALHHPLLESIPLDSASGIITNFSGGSSLSFLEVAEALTNLQSMTNHHADIIPGITQNEDLDDRVQVIMIITGLGATPMESSAVVSSRKVEIKEPEKMVEKPAGHKDIELASIAFESTSLDLDVPAFMRRRVR